MSLRRQMRSVLTLVAVILPLLVGCDRSPTGVANRKPVTLHLSADALSSTVTLVVVKVTAADIPVPLVFNFPVSGGAISGTITVPAGSARTITASAYDAGNTETHRGVITLDLPAGTQPVLDLKLLPLTSDQPITITVTSLTITVTPPTATLTVGTADLQLAASIADAEGNPVTGTVRWATLDPGVATVSATGLVHATGGGNVQIVATFAGVAGACTLTVFGGTTASLAIVAADLTDPVYVTSPPGDDRLFVVEKEGQIIVIKNGATLATPFLDLSSKVITTSEMGLLSVAFHPNFAQNHQLYVLYNLDEGGNVERVARFTVSANADVADAGSETVILETPPRSTDYHNGGLLQFGPDGKLYVGFGDAGTSSNAQSLASLHGKILRLDVDGGSPYAIPIDNPFRGQSGARGEIWEYGFRNPWRYSFDSQTGDLYIADVGEDNVEEVDALLALTPAGRNFGWPVMEGNTCYLAQSCNQTGLTQPVLTYTHAEGCAVVGGYVYRGRGIRELTGQYLYSDLCGGFIRSFTYVNGVVASRHDWTAQLGGALSQVSSFGQDWRGELYITTLGAGTGTLYKFVPAD